MADEPAILLSDIGSADLVRVSRSSWWRGVKSGLFPPPVKVGGLTRWRRDEILAAVERLTAERDGQAA